MKKKAEEKLSFSSIEIILMIVMVALVIVSAITVVTITTRRQKINNFKEDAVNIVSSAKNAYAAFSITKKTDYIVESEDGLSKGMCITLSGLYENGYSKKDYEKEDGYVVIEESANHDFHYTLWFTDKKYVIDGYDSERIKDLEINDGITAYNKDSFSSKVRTSFTGTTSDKGGTGNEKTAKRYEAPCVNEKVE